MTKAPPSPEPEPDPCGRCGGIHWRSGKHTCRAHRGGKKGQPLRPCKKYPIRGHDVCEDHGGRAEQVQAKARANLEERALEDRLRRFDFERIPEEFVRQHPVEGLLYEVALSAWFVRILQAEMSLLDMPDPHDTGPLADVTGVDEDGEPILRQNRSLLYGPDHNRDLAIHPLWKKFDEERDRHARLCRMAIDAGVSERLVRIAELQAVAVVDVIVGTIDELGFTPEVRDRAKRIAGQRLRALSAALPAPGEISA